MGNPFDRHPPSYLQYGTAGTQGPTERPLVLEPSDVVLLVTPCAEPCAPTLATALRCTVVPARLGRLCAVTSMLLLGGTIDIACTDWAGLPDSSGRVHTLVPM